MTDEEFFAWQIDPTSRRILLVELDYAGGMVTLASKAWIGETGIPYDNWLISDPSIESNLNNFAGIGDLEAVNLDDAFDWKEQVWHGHQCRLLLGDERWKRSDFKIVARSLIEECRFLGGRAYRFNLMQAGRRLEQPFTSTAATKSHNVSAAITYLQNETDTVIALSNVSSAKQDWSLSYDVDENTTLASVLQLIATSIGGHLRVDSLDNIEILIPSSTVKATLTASEIENDGLTVAEVEPPYATVTVVKSDGTKVSASTGVDVGDVENEIQIQTALSNTTHAQALRDELLSYYANTRVRWTVPALTGGESAIEGDIVEIDHPELRGAGLVVSAVKAPLSMYNRLEVRI